MKSGSEILRNVGKFHWFATLLLQACYFSSGLNLSRKRAPHAPFLTKMEKHMNGIIQFIRSLVFIALMLGAAGTLVEATGLIGREAAKAHQHGGMSFKWMNQQLVGGGK